MFSFSKRYLIKDIIAEGYERWAHICNDSINISLWVHFLQHQEYVDSTEESKIIKKGNSVEGKLSIDLVTKLNINSQSVIGFNQPFDKSSHIIANGVVMNIINDFSILCHIEGLHKGILVEFETKFELKMGDKISFFGSLEIEIDKIIYN